MKRHFLPFLLPLLMILMLPLAYGEEDVHALIQSGDPLTVEAKVLGSIPHVDSNFRVLQGGCVRDGYGWFALIGADKAQYNHTTECYILKMDLETMEVIAQSQMLKLAHANDITYIPQTHEIYVIHTYKKLISILDADTLEVKGTRKLPKEGYALDYEETSDRFVTAHGYAGMYFFNADLEQGKMIFGTETTLVTQGICCDEKYIYHVLWSSEDNTAEPDNMIFVFDWDGNLITKIPIGINEHEPENITLIGDTFYIAFNDRVERKCAWLYTMQLKKAE